MGASTTLAILILLGSSFKAEGFMFNHAACGCPPPPPPPKCDCACAQAASQYAPQYASQAAYAPQTQQMYAAPVYAQQQQQAYASQVAAATAARPQSASEAYDAAIDNAVLDSLPSQVGLASPAPSYQGPAGAYATENRPYPSTAALNGFPSSQQSAYAQPAQSSAVYGGQQAQSYISYVSPQSQSTYQQTQSAYAQPQQQQSSAVYVGQQTQSAYAQPGQSSAVYGGSQQAYPQAASTSSAYSLSVPPSQAQQQYVVADSAALNAFSQTIASQPLPGLAASQASYARPTAAINAGLPASTIQYATVPAGVAVDQHLARQIANEAATYVSSANNDGNQYVQTKQNAFARQHNPTVNEYARVGETVQGGSAAREQYLTQPQPIPASVTYLNANTHAYTRKPPVLVLPVVDRQQSDRLPIPPAPSRAQFTAPSDIEILAAEQSDPMVLTSAIAQHDAPPLPAVPAPQTVIETVDTTSLVLPTNDIITQTDAAEVSESVSHLEMMTAQEFDQALQQANQDHIDDHASVSASVHEEPIKQHSVVEGESEFQGAPLTEENLLESNDNIPEHNIDQNQQDQQQPEQQEQPASGESETLPDTEFHLQDGISIKTRVHAAPTARVPHRDFGLARH